MRLAAIYIEDHEYIFDEPQTINFGGQFFYEFENLNGDIIVRRKPNEKFIPDFFNITNAESKVTNLSAIVGQNGAGKSTILDIIRSSFIESQYALPQSKALFLSETDGPQIAVLRNDFKKVLLYDGLKVELKNKRIEKPQTIFYSPHFDFKFNPDFDEIDNHDLSFDKIVEQDLSELQEKEIPEGGRPYSASQELLFKNSMRQIAFLSSDLVQKNIFQDIFEFQNHYAPVLYFTGYDNKEKKWNTPYGFRDILEIIENKIEKERAEWSSLSDEESSQLGIYKHMLKRNVLRCILTLLYRQMERRNSFLKEGFFPFEELKSQIQNASAHQIFLLFAKHSSIRLRNSNTRKVLSESVLALLIEKIYSAIDKVETKDSISKSSLHTSTENAVELLKLQRQFLNELNSYYRKFYDKTKEFTYDTGDRMEGFINYMPFSRRMSSGQGALLNFFSRIYDFLDSNLKEHKYRKLSNHYILLLDEADLSFHITWKKKYVKALLSTLPHFFDELENKPSLEIIFTTHDPIALSDIPNTNVVYVERPRHYNTSRVLDFQSKRRPLNTFGANISDLIADSFFVENSLIGDFASDKIQETIKWLNDKNDQSKREYYRRLIQLIDEPIIQRKLAEMYDDKTRDNFQFDIIEEQIERLVNLRKKLLG